MRFPVLQASLAVAVAACSVDTIPSSLQPTPPGTGPTVVFDLLHQPLPDIPQPNDIATFADPTSPTGRRLNASLVAPTYMEQQARAEFDEMEGWGTTAPLSVHFTPEAGGDPLAAAIDLDDLRLRMQADGWDTTNDALYVVNLKTGVPALLDVGQGDFPTTVLDPTQYYPNDPRASAQNLVVETVEEGAGLPQSSYVPSLDTDFDGVLDHPDTLASQASRPGAILGIDDVMSWYERETDTLIVRPLLPLDEMTEYAVVLTDRLHGPDGQPVRSPFPDVYHPAQRASIQQLENVLSDPTRSNYYGDIAGTGLAHVAFAWTFTTQPVAHEMVLLRDGLYGQGPFARISTQFSTQATLFQAAGKALTPDTEPSGWQSLPECVGPTKTPFVAHWADAKDAVTQLLPQLFPLSASQTQGLLDSLDAVDYFVIGTYDTPYFIGDPQSTNPYDHFDANFVTGQATIHHDTGHFWISIPKAANGFGPPFNVAYWHHGTGLFDTEMFIHAGRYAKNGLALVSIDSPGHGLYLTQGQEALLSGLLSQDCLEPFTNGVDSGRAIDLNGDGIPDSGGLIWSAHLLRTRDNVRQAIVDAMQMTRIMTTFDGSTLSDQDYNGDGVLNDLAGDFNGDGVVDLGGPTAKYYASGGSLGGIVSMLQGAIDPQITAAAPVSGTGGFMDTAMRGIVTPVPVLEQTLGPLVIGVPASSRSGQTQCTGDQVSVRWYVNDLFNTVEIEIACLDSPSEIGSGMTVLVRDSTSGQIDCGRTGDGGTFRVPIPVTIGDSIAIQVLNAPDAIDSYKTCNTLPGAPIGRAITTWEQPATAYTPVATPGLTCTATAGCAQFRQTFYPVGSPLVAPQEGIGLRRQTPDFRQLIQLAQAAMDPADPMNYGRYYMLSSLPALGGGQQAPRPLLVATTAGDNQVTTASGLAFARAAGAVPFLPPSAVTSMPDYADYATPQALWNDWGGQAPNQVLIANYQMEGVSRLGRMPGTACGNDYAASATCNSPPAPESCVDTLYDADWLGETLDTYGQQHANPPLRLARLAQTRAVDPTSLAAAWAPRIQGAPFANDGAWTPDQPLVASVTAYLDPNGQHDWSVGDPCDSWDGTTYMDNLLGHFFVTNGQDLYYLSHPSSHACLATTSCPFFQ